MLLLKTLPLTGQVSHGNAIFFSSLNLSCRKTIVVDLTQHDMVGLLALLFTTLTFFNPWFATSTPHSLKNSQLETPQAVIHQTPVFVRLPSSKSLLQIAYALIFFQIRLHLRHILERSFTLILCFSPFLYE